MNELVLGEAAHSIYSASGSKMWLACPGSIWLSKGLKEAPSEFAMAGSAAHFCAEGIQRDGLSEEEVLVVLEAEHPKWYEVFLKQDRADFFNAVWVYVNWMRDKIEAHPSAEAMYEQRVRLGFIHPQMYGTADFLQFELFGDLESCDYKHGKGVPVDVAETEKIEDANSQQAYYLLAAAHRYAYNFENVHMTIVQPRAPHVEGPIRSRTYDMEDFREVWTEKFTRGVARIEEARTAPKIDAYLEPGDHCRWCKARATCPALRKKTYDIAQMDFDPITLNADVDRDKQLPDPVTLSKAQLKLVLDHAGMIDGWLKGVEAHAESLLEHGETVPGYKLVAKRPSRKWIDQKKVLTLLKRRKTLSPEDYLTEPKLLSAPQMDTKFRKANPKLWATLEKHVHKVSSGKTMAREDDKRPALEHQKAQDDFDAIGEADEKSNG